MIFTTDNNTAGLVGLADSTLLLGLQDFFLLLMFAHKQQQKKKKKRALWSFQKRGRVFRVRLSRMFKRLLKLDWLCKVDKGHSRISRGARSNKRARTPKAAVAA